MKRLTQEDLISHIQGQRDTWMGVSAVLGIIILVLLAHIFG